MTAVHCRSSTATHRINGRKTTEIQLNQAFIKIKELSELLKAENQYLRETISSQGRYENIIGQSDAIQHVLGKIEQVAETSATVLLQGETGTGKTLLANAASLQQCVDAGKLGIQSGEGFYTYPGPAYAKPEFVSNKK